jgi:hypothetical protein
MVHLARCMLRRKPYDQTPTRENLQETVLQRIKNPQCTVLEYLEGTVLCLD